MALAIAWRNPTSIHTTKRCIKFENDLPGDIYVVQELIAEAKEGRWANMSVLEVLCSSDVEASRVSDHTSNESGATGDGSREPAAR
jgi:hypothetical protein